MIVGNRKRIEGEERSTFCILWDSQIMKKNAHGGLIPPQTPTCPSTSWGSSKPLLTTCSGISQLPESSDRIKLLSFINYHLRQGCYHYIKWTEVPDKSAHMWLGHPPCQTQVVSNVKLRVSLLTLTILIRSQSLARGRGHDRNCTLVVDLLKEDDSHPFSG